MLRSWIVQTSGTPSRYVCVLFSNHSFQKFFFGGKQQQTPAKQVGVMCGPLLYMVSQLNCKASLFDLDSIWSHMVVD